jgi:hypothetical protein
LEDCLLRINFREKGKNNSECWTFVVVFGRFIGVGYLVWEELARL